MIGMEWIEQAIDLFLHLDRHLNAWLQDYGAWTYAILFAIIFCETGLVITPFLPGDSLLFAAGALSASGPPLRPEWLFLLLSLAAIAGDTVNYWIGHWFGEGLVRRFPRLIKEKHLRRTHEYFERYGASTIVLARFVPIIRTFAPFVAGGASMTYSRFLTYNVLGGCLWIGLFVFAGYLFGNHPIVRDNFGYVILAIIVLSMVPIAVEVVRQLRNPVSR